MAKFFQFEFRDQIYLFKFNLAFSILCIFLVSLCCFLGNWQIYRYHFKKNLQLEYQNNIDTLPLPLNAVDPKPFQKVFVKGEYLNQLNIYWQNRFYQSTPGFEVLTPFKIPGEKKLLLVDRGWLPLHSEDAVKNVNGPQQLKGAIKLLDGYTFIIGPNILGSKQFPLRIQKVDLDALTNITHNQFFPLILRLDADEANGFNRDWSMNTMSPERHLSYAVQWFAFACILIIGFFCFCCEKKNANDSN